MSSPQPIVVPVECAPGPLPTTLHLVVDETRHMVILYVFDPSGQRAVFLDPDVAQQLAGALEQSSRLARSGLVIAAPDTLPAPERTHRPTRPPRKT